MIIVTLTYKKPLLDVDALLEDHIAFLQNYYVQKKFLASGRRENRVGGVILVLSSSIEEAQQIIKNDPFYIHDLADYDFMWFEASKCADEIKALV
ncbi:GTP cyclohydrolase [Acinetobacter qingfengensis]|uniref:GTP cyclohydrolase n=1 Tax=Acinetobacter qingfengensis TaxID=1262585 RepID=A0A1E7R1R8_9GAMM|nr:YciI family protein [Acinetobacter qingfengensis]KAA8733180.1 GTP cyclohydrolase [Acinetobacter qingfengensis]OEY93250.1 GTP cyclohydrolase [Acinetobacter qingfengensis]